MRLLADVDQLTEEQEMQLYKKWDTTPAETLNGAVALREWLQKQPHLPKLTGKLKRGPNYFPITVRSVGSRVRGCFFCVLNVLSNVLHTSRT